MREKKCDRDKKRWNREKRWNTNFFKGGMEGKKEWNEENKWNRDKKSGKGRKWVEQSKKKGGKGRKMGGLEIKKGETEQKNKDETEKNGWIGENKSRIRRKKGVIGRKWEEHSGNRLEEGEKRWNTEGEGGRNSGLARKRNKAVFSLFLPLPAHSQGPGPGPRSEHLGVWESCKGGRVCQNPSTPKEHLPRSGITIPVGIHPHLLRFRNFPGFGGILQQPITASHREIRCLLPE